MNAVDDGWRSCTTCPAPRDCKTHGCGVVRKLWPAEWHPRESLAGKGPLEAAPRYCPHGYALGELADGTVTCERCSRPPSLAGDVSAQDCAHPAFDEDGVCTCCKEHYDRRHDKRGLAGKGPLITFWEDGSVTVDDRPAGEFPFKPEPQ